MKVYKINGSIFYGSKFFILLSIGIVILTFFVLFSAYSSYLFLRSDVKLRITNDSILVSEWIKSSFLNSDYVLRDIIEDVESSDLLYSNSTHNINRIRYLQLERKRLSYTNATHVALFNHQCLITQSKSSNGLDASLREYCQQVQKSQVDNYVSTAFKTKFDTFSIIQAHKFGVGHHSFSGFAAFLFGEEFFNQLISKLSLREGVLLSIADTNGVILARNPYLPGAIGKVGHVDRIQSFIESGETTIYFEDQSPIDSVNRLYTLRKVKDLPFVIVVGEANNIWSIQHREMVVIVSIFIVVIVALFVVAWKNYRLLGQMALGDALTGLGNRRAFFEYGKREISRYKRYGKVFSVIYFDLDFFKKLNDNEGHDVGDLYLEQLGKLLISCLREPDFPARIGGEEFAVILPETEWNEAALIAERLRGEVEKMSLELPTKKISLTGSFGVSTVNEKNDDLRMLLKECDNLLYLAKQRGRNRVELKSVAT